MPYVERDETGKIVGMQKWTGERYTELLPDDHPEVMAFRQPPPDPTEELLAGLTALRGTGATVDQLIDVLTGTAGKKGRVAGRPV